MRHASPLLALACLAPVAAAQTVHQDMLLMIDPEGALVTGLVDFSTQTPLADSQRVFDATFEIIPIGGGIEFAVTDVPGFNALLPSNSAIPAGFSTLPPNAEVSFDAPAIEIDGVLANLWHWDGTGNVEFAPATILTSISKAPSGLFNASLDGSSNDIDGFVINFTNSSGGLHQHVDFQIANSPLAPEGFYLWSFVLTVDELVAEPVYFVHALGAFDQQAYDDAMDYVRSTFVDPVLLCAGDFDGDNDVDLGDFGVFGAAFGTTTGDANFNPSADFDNAGDVDLGDFGVFGAEFGSGPTTCAG